jgi:hypothetical protein
MATDLPNGRWEWWPPNPVPMTDPSPLDVREPNSTVNRLYQPNINLVPKSLPETSPGMKTFSKLQGQTSHTHTQTCCKYSDRSQCDAPKLILTPQLCNCSDTRQPWSSASSSVLTVMFPSNSPTGIHVPMPQCDNAQYCMATSAALRTSCTPLYAMATSSNH